MFMASGKAMVQRIEPKPAQKHAAGQGVIGYAEPVNDACTSFNYRDSQNIGPDFVLADLFRESDNYLCGKGHPIYVGVPDFVGPTLDSCMHEKVSG